MSCKILSTKKLLPELIRQANEKNIDVREVEFISVKTILTKEKWDEINALLNKNDIAAVFTSANAVESVEKYLNSYVNYIQPRWKIYCLSGRTKTIVEHSELLSSNISGTGKNANELSEVIVSRNEKEVIFFCGDQRRDELPNQLKQNGIKVYECIVYETIETPSVIAEPFDAVLFFSPSAVKSFFSVNVPDTQSICFAVGETTASEIKEHTDQKIIISKNNSQEGVMESVYKYFYN